MSWAMDEKTYDRPCLGSFESPWLILLTIWINCCLKMGIRQIWCSLMTSYRWIGIWLFGKNWLEDQVRVIKAQRVLSMPAILSRILTGKYRSIEVSIFFSSTIWMTRSNYLTGCRSSVPVRLLRWPILKFEADSWPFQTSYPVIDLPAYLSIASSVALP